MLDDETNILSENIAALSEDAAAIKETLQTDARVFARITDGIYRQPGSAIRELISNAYDADATRVTVHTDIPRFQEITVRDNGRGMTPSIIANVIKHIGGSLKRTWEGVEQGVSAKGRPGYSPGGRKLIGKIGIGLFSVAQLTSHFQVITKVKGENYRWLLDIVLQTYTEEELAQQDVDKKFSSGTVQIKKIPAEDLNAQGTDIVLLNVKPAARELLRTDEIWKKILTSDDEDDGDEVPPDPPIFHIGSIDLKTGLTIENDANLPWREECPPEDRFKALVVGVTDLYGTQTSNPKLERDLDNYLRMIWDLSLAVPVDYMGTSPFDLSRNSGCRFYTLSNQSKGQAKPCDLGENHSIGAALELEKEKALGSRIQVFVDGMELKKPFDFEDIPETHNRIKEPMVFFGSYRADFESVPIEMGGTPLAFQAYFYMHPSVAVPAEHAGVLIRINGASGTLFDDTFMRYKVAENNRLKKITAEIFVHEGLDAAQNIDRESFNFAHPHYQVIMKWVHNALRQISNQHKKLGREMKDLADQEHYSDQNRTIDHIVLKQWKRHRDFELDSPPPVRIVEDTQLPLEHSRQAKTIRLEREKVLPKYPGRRHTEAQTLIREKRAVAITQILEAYGLLDHLDNEDLQEFVQSIMRIFEETV